mmetsp:Transcript_17448/g.25437  ORF Transcript_17448/g.25437 Transcript_17448/m.25437 type:complete len:166 (+) Transcript_17448:450-947(+)
MCRNDTVPRTWDVANGDVERFTDDWEIKAYSTNYLRTVKSCQCFLDGLLSTAPDDSPASTSPSNGDDSKVVQTHYENINPQEYQRAKSAEHEDNRVTIKVRDRKDDTLNAFDKSPELMKSLVQDVVTTDHFIDRDTKASSYGGPSGINWIHASDHFVCRSSHDAP